MENPAFFVGWSPIRKFGNNPDIDSGTVPETVWEGGGLYNFLTAPAVLEVLSSSASDTALGVGARSVKITGLDSNWRVQEEVVILNGLTPVQTSLTWWRINSFSVVSSGTSLGNVGNISLRSLGGGLLRDYISIGTGTSRTAVFSVPAGNYMFFETFTLTQTTDTPTAANAFILEARYFYSPSNTVQRPVRVRLFTQATPYIHHDNTAGYVPEKTDYSWEVVAASSNNTGVGVYFTGYVIDSRLQEASSFVSSPRW